MRCEQSGTSRQFRTKPSDRAIGWFGGALFGLASLGSGIGALVADSPQDRFSSLFACIVSGLFVLLSVYLLLWCKRHLLVLGTGRIERRDVVRLKALRASEISAVQWRRQPKGGSVVLSDGRRRLVIVFNNYTPVAKRELVDALRKSIPAAAAQSGWDEFQAWQRPKCSDSELIRRVPRTALICSLLAMAVAIATMVVVDTMGASVPGGAEDVSLAQRIATVVIGFGSIPLLLKAVVWLSARLKAMDE